MAGTDQNSHSMVISQNKRTIELHTDQVFHETCKKSIAQFDSNKFKNILKFIKTKAQ